ncbi:MAG TPA: hypothetical protein VJR94_07525 [Candidatus Nitrosocosmicus sp.]|nr:hypothetical protein [Candidatus Nitrosocosmicus sp.]
MTAIYVPIAPIAIIVNASMRSWIDILYNSGAPFPNAPAEVATSTFVFATFSDYTMGY